MYEIIKKPKMQKILLLLLLFVTSLRASWISEKCHCDITSSFCDFGCCCDLDCGTVFDKLNLDHKSVLLQYL